MYFFSRQHSFALHASSPCIELAAPRRNVSILPLGNMGKGFNFPSETPVRPNVTVAILQST